MNDPLGLLANQSQNDPLGLMSPPAPANEGIWETTKRVAKNATEIPRALGETAANLGSGIVGAGAGALAGLYTQAFTGGDTEAAKAVQEGVARQITFDPNDPEISQYTTELGKNLSRNLGFVGSIPAQIGGEVADLPLESWGASEATRYPLKTGAEFAAYGAVNPIGRSVVRGVKRGGDIAAETFRGMVPSGLENVMGGDVPPTALRIRPVEAITRSGEVTDGRLLAERSVAEPPRPTLSEFLAKHDKLDPFTPESDAVSRGIIENISVLGENEAVARVEVTPEVRGVSPEVTKAAPDVIPEAAPKVPEKPPTLPVGETSPVAKGEIAPSALPEAAAVNAGDVSQKNTTPNGAIFEGGGTGIKNATTLAEREARGLSEVEVETRRSNPVAFDEGMRRIESGEVDPRILAEELTKKPRPITPEETAVLTIDRQRIKADHKAAMDSVEKAMDSGDTIAEAEARVKLAEVEETYNTNDTAARLTGYEQGAGLQARKMLIDEDYSLAAMVQKARVDNGGKPISEATRKKFEVLSKQIEDLTSKVKEYEEGKAQSAIDTAVKKMQLDVAKEQRQTKRTYIKKELSDEFDMLVKDLNKVLGGQLNAGVDPVAVVILGRMARNRVKSGVVSAEGIIDSIYVEVQKMGVELSKRDIRDAISGYGVTSKPSAEIIASQLREAKHQMRLISALEDAKAKQVPLRSGFQRGESSDTVRSLERQVKQAMRESGIDSSKTRTPEEQWKTSLEAVKTRLKNNIADLVKRMETGQKEPKKLGIKYDEQANELKKLRDKIQEVLDFAEGTKGGKDVPPEQRIRAATTALEKSIAEYERRLTENDLAPQKRTSTTPSTPELTALRKERDLLKDLFRALQEEAKPVKTPEEIALQSFKTRTKNQIETLEKKLSLGDFSKPEKRKTTLDPEGLSLKFKLDQAKQEYHKAAMLDRLANRTPSEKFAGGVAEAMNLSRAVKTSMDLSAVFRQGGLLHFGDPRLLGNSVRGMFQALRSEKGQYAVEQEIINRPNYPLYEQGKLFLSEHGQELSKMEENYMSRHADQIPGVAASQRAYTANLNILRADKFDQLVAALSKSGKPTPAELKAIGTFVNEFTGRGTVRGRENALVNANTVFFAPRLVLSRFQVLMGHPLKDGTARTRILFAKEYAKTLTGIGVFVGLALAAGAKMETDPRSSEFAKLKFGNTRIDPWAGLIQETVLMSRLISGKTKTAAGRVSPIRGDKVPYGSGNSADIIARFLRSKLSPAVGTGVDIATGKDVVGKKVTAGTIPEKLLLPLSFNDIYEAMKEQGIPAGTALGILSVFGMGVQTYDAKQRNK